VSWSVSIVNLPKHIVSYHRASHKIVISFHVEFIEHKDDVSIAHCPGQIINAVDSDPSVVSTFHDPISPIDSVSPTSEIAVSPDSNSLSAPVGIPSCTPPISSSSVDENPIPSSLPLLSPSTLQTDSLDSISSPSPAEPELPKRVSKPSARKRAAMDKQTALLSNISTYLSELEARNKDAADHLAYAFDDLSKLPDVAYDDSIPAPGDPKTYQEAMNSPDADHWMESMKDELASLRKYDVYELIPRSSVPSDHKVL
jgi:hypothetical protein